MGWIHHWVHHFMVILHFTGRTWTIFELDSSTWKTILFIYLFFFFGGEESGTSCFNLSNIQMNATKQHKYKQHAVKIIQLKR